MRIVLDIPAQIVTEKGRKHREEGESARKGRVKIGTRFAMLSMPALKGSVMRFTLVSALAVMMIAFLPSPSSAQTSLDGFGAVRMDHLAAIGDSDFPVDFGGRVSFDVVPAVQVFGEFGRLANIMPPLVETGLAFSRIGLTASAFYGEGGVRFLAFSESAVIPYGEATAGVAHLSFGGRGLDGPADALVRTLLGLTDTRDPMFGAGGGVLIRAGALHFDVGYRYKRIMANSAVSSLLGMGGELESHQVRFGAGVRF
jgi:hypothetical protein